MAKEWEIGKDEYLQRLECPNAMRFRGLLKLPDVKKVKKVVPLRNMKVISSLVPMSNETLLYLLRKIKTMDGQTPFINSCFSLVKHNPNLFKIGQKFVYRQNYIGLLEGLSNNFQQFSIINGGFIFALLTLIGYPVNSTRLRYPIEFLLNMDFTALSKNIAG